MRCAASLLSLLLILACSSSIAISAPPGFKTLAIGDSAPAFSLPGTDDKTYSLDSFKDAPYLLVIFTCNHCPTAQAYEDRILQLHADYKDRGVALAAISPNDDQAVRLDELGYSDLGDSLADMKLRAAERGFQFPYLYDGETQATSLAYGVVATPQCFLFDPERKLRYVGRIDDSDVKTVTSHDLRKALDALLAGKPIPVEKTRTFGCSTKWSDKRTEAQASIEKWNQEPVELSDIGVDEVQALVKNDTPQLLMINVWATWCGPCVTEMPELVDIHRMYRRRDFRMVTITIDDPAQKAAALKVLQTQHASMKNHLSAVPKLDDLADALDAEWNGALPYTVLIAPGGKVIFRQEGQLDPLAVRRAIVDQLGRTYANRKAE
ncbi:redoxin domain-containing protein [Planctomicrobium piriforme]|uniref:Peroxiredoxin n=1 Tax=Planctomicrobium piriforme TaxID=1576369 RepID=A0A1I3DIF5_9PLAN|nr:redoxin domain-containing protein [Planctomicrobium piriforme]SFH86530.1 Peroxiredoxin [Planctomicrobium piriforme]